MHCCPWLESPDFCSPLGQFNGVSWSDFKVSPLSPHLVAVDLVYSHYSTLVLAVAVSSHNLVPRLGTIGMQCEYYTTGTIFARLVLCCSLKTYSRIIAIWPTNKNKYYCRIFVTSPFFCWESSCQQSISFACSILAYLWKILHESRKSFVEHARHLAEI